MKAEIQENLINFKLSGSTRNVLFLMILIGIVSFVGGFFGLHLEARHPGAHSNPAWSALLVATVFILGIAITGVFFTAIGHITGAHWLVTIRRITENFGKFLPVGLLLLAILVIFGTHDLYEWSHTDNPEIMKDKLIPHKSAWLNAPFFIVRLIVIAGIWSLFGFLFHRNSVAQDTDKDVSHTSTNAKLAGGFLLFFTISFSVVAFDLLMSLTPHWFSTMWGVYIFAGAYQTGLSALAVSIFYLKKNGYLGDAVNDNHIHDVGKFILSFCVFWAYIAFSQFMLMWYANLPEETFWFEQRLMGGWTAISYAIPFIKFIIPFFLLLNRPNKRDINFLAKVALWILFSHVIELYWIVFPSNFEHFNIAGLGVTLGVSIGVVGLFGLVVLKYMESSKLIPVGDPRIEKSLGHHQ